MVLILNTCSICKREWECREVQTGYICDDCLPPDRDLDDGERPGDDE